MLEGLFTVVTYLSAGQREIKEATSSCIIQMRQDTSCSEDSNKLFFKSTSSQCSQQPNQSFCLDCPLT